MQLSSDLLEPSMMKAKNHRLSLCGICIFTAKCLPKSFPESSFITSVNNIGPHISEHPTEYGVGYSSHYSDGLQDFMGILPTPHPEMIVLTLLTLMHPVQGNVSHSLYYNRGLGIVATEFWQSSLQSQSNGTAMIWNTWSHSVDYLLSTQKTTYQLSTRYCAFFFVMLRKSLCPTNSWLSFLRVHNHIF